MAKWYEGAEEAAFKPVAFGYIFQPPGLFWPFTRQPAYLVNEAQKAELIACLRRQRRRVFLLVVVYALIVMGLGMAAGMALSRGARIPATELIAILIVTALAVIPIVIVPHIYLVRTMRPLLAELPRTEERITLRDQLQSLAGAISGKLLLLGAIGGSMMVIGNIVSIVDAIAEGRGGGFYSSIVGLVIGALLTSYFGYLAVLKRKLKRKAN
jgi:hypothetical protein